MLESQIQARLIAQLRADGWMVIKLSLTNPTGIPDLLCIRSGTHLFIECKRPGSKPRPLQHIRHTELQQHGASVIIYDGTTDIQNILTK